MRRDEVLQHGQALAEGRADRQVNDASGRVAHEAAHAGHLGDLADVTLGARDGHDVDPAVLFEPVLDDMLDVFCRLAPDGDRLIVALVFGDQALVELIVDLGDAGVGVGEHPRLLLRQAQVVHRDRDA